LFCKIIIESDLSLVWHGISLTVSDSFRYVDDFSLDSLQLLRHWWAAFHVSKEISNVDVCLFEMLNAIKSVCKLAKVDVRAISDIKRTVNDDRVLKSPEVKISRFLVCPSKNKCVRNSQICPIFDWLPILNIILQLCIESQYWRCERNQITYWCDRLGRGTSPCWRGLWVAALRVRRPNIAIQWMVLFNGRSRGSIEKDEFSTGFARSAGPGQVRTRAD
jgi:hypothetical protein